MGGSAGGFLRGAASLCLFGAAACAGAQSMAQVADWPNKPVRFIVPFPPGGSVDPLARLTGARLNIALGDRKSTRLNSSH